MRKHLVGLDHVVLRVADLGRAATDFAAMGFTLTPRGRHSLGTENHCLMFGFDYLELLWVPDAIKPPFYADFPIGGEGITGIALKSNKAAAVQAAWAQAGLHPEPVIDFSRPVADDNGSAAGLARFRVVALPSERTPGARGFACQHLTPDLVWRPGLRRHSNHVTGINKVVIASTDPEAVGALWGNVFDVAPHPIPGGVSVTTGAAPIVALTPDALARQLPHVDLPAIGELSRVAVVYLSTNDLAAASAVIRSAGIRAVALPGGQLAVPPADAHGVALVFK